MTAFLLRIMKPISKTKLVLSILFSFLLFFEGSCQDIFKRKVVFAELLGGGGYGSINYDFRFTPGNSGLGLRIGIGYFPTGTIFPVEVNGLLGKKRFSFEYGAGLSTAFYNASVSETLGIVAFGKAGVRFTPTDNGLFANLYWNPFLTPGEPFLGWFGLGVGYSWKKIIR
jgi:hypothetical protein